MHALRIATGTGKFLLPLVTLLLSACLGLDPLLVAARARSFEPLDDDTPSKELERFQQEIASHEAALQQPYRSLHGVLAQGTSADKPAAAANSAGAGAVFSAGAAAGIQSNHRPENYSDLGDDSSREYYSNAWDPSDLRQPVERSSEAGFASCGFPEIDSTDECVAELAAFPELSARSGSPTVRRLACLAHTYLRPWMAIPGVKRGMGARGMISPRILQRMGSMGNVLSCAGHVRIVNGEIFFRFGGFEFLWYRMRRFIFSLRMIKEAIALYNLHFLNAEFFLNTCDMHVSKGSSIADLRAGLPIFSPHGAPGSIDLLYPDPVDLSESYFRSAEDAVPWEQKQSRAVFRGGMTNFRVKYDRQWRASARFRVHRMSNVRPDLLDAKVVKGVGEEFADSLHEDGIEMGERMGPSELQSYKYELDVDGGTGSGRVCGILSSNQMLMKQTSEYTQFFDPLLCPNQHFVPTHRYFSNLFQRIEWARDHDNAAKRIVKRANRLASDVCTWEGRRLYWAILLVKYSASALENPGNVTRPITFQCQTRPTQDDVENNSIYSKKMPSAWPPVCDNPGASENQPPCTHFCRGRMLEPTWKWLPVSILDDVKVYKPQNGRIRFQTE